MRQYICQLFTYARYGQSGVVKVQSIQPRFIRDVPEDDTPDGIGYSNNSDQETGVLGINIQIKGFVLQSNHAW